MGQPRGRELAGGSEHLGSGVVQVVSAQQPGGGAVSPSSGFRPVNQACTTAGVSRAISAAGW